MFPGNVPIALATDYNPNAHCLSLPFVMNLACVNMGMTLNEALVFNSNSIDFRTRLLNLFKV